MSSFCLFQPKFGATCFKIKLNFFHQKVEYKRRKLAFTVERLKEQKVGLGFICFSGDEMRRCRKALYLDLNSLNLEKLCLYFLHLVRAHVWEKE